jgi:hypothetical protein
MRIGAFEVVEPLPALREPHAIAMLRPWVDAGNVGALTLLDIEQQFGANHLAALARPGSFYDLTRYRPTVYVRNGVRELSVPNTVVSYVTRPEGPDLVIIKMLEPHMFAEVYVESILSLLRALEVRRYTWVGSMYDMVPHTRPLLVSGGALGAQVEAEARRLNILPTDYQGPSTLTFQIVQRAPLMGIEALWCIVHLPQYVQVEEDYAGKVRLMQVLRGLYHVDIDEADVERAREQAATMDTYVSHNPELATVLAHFEARYESRLRKREHETPPLSPDMVRFLNDIGRRRNGAD